MSGHDVYLNSMVSADGDDEKSISCHARENQRCAKQHQEMRAKQGCCKKP